MKIIWNFKIKYIPADTKVAEWIKDEAGTGASIESGNHRWPINWADLIDPLNIKHTEVKNIFEFILDVLNDTTVNSVSMLLILYIFHNIAKPVIKKISLILLKVKALKLQAKVVVLNFQKLINKKDVSPINSHPKIKLKKLLLITKNIIEKINQLISKINSSNLSSYLK